MAIAVHKAKNDAAEQRARDKAMDAAEATAIVEVAFVGPLLRQHHQKPTILNAHDKN